MVTIATTHFVYVQVISQSISVMLRCVCGQLPGVCVCTHDGECGTYKYVYGSAPYTYLKTQAHTNTSSTPVYVCVCVVN